MLFYFSNNSANCCSSWSFHVERNLFTMGWAHLSWPDFSRASVRQPFHSQELSSVLWGWNIMCIVWWQALSFPELRRPTRSWQSLESVSSSRCMCLSFWMTVTLTPIIKVTASLWDGHYGEQSGNTDSPAMSSLTVAGTLSLKWLLLHSAVWEEVAEDEATIASWSSDNCNYKKHKRYFKDLRMSRKL